MLKKLMMVLIILLSHINIFSEPQAVPKLVLQNGHSHSVDVVKYSQDGKYFASVSSFGKEIKIWDAMTYELLATIAESTNDVEFLPNSHQIILTADQNLLVYDFLNHKKVKMTAPHKGYVQSIQMSKDASLIVTGSGSSKGFHGVSVFNSKTFNNLKNFYGHPYPVRFTAISSDNRTIAASGGDNLLFIWNVSSGKLIKTVDARLGGITAIDISPDNKHIIVGGSGTLKILDASNGNELKSMTAFSSLPNLRDWVACVKYTRDGKWIIGGYRNGAIVYFNAQSGEKIKVISGHSDYVNTLALNPEQDKIISGSSDPSIKVWDVKTGTLLKSLVGNGLTISDVFYVNNDSQIIIGSTSKKFKMIHSDTLQVTANGPAYHYAGMQKNVKNRMILKNEKESPLFSSWDTLKWVHTPLAKNLDKSIDLIPGFGGKAMGYGSTKEGLKIYDVENGQVLFDFKGSFGSNPVFSPDGKRVAFGSENNSIKIHSAENGQLLKTIQIKKKNRLDSQTVYFSPDGKYLLSHNYYASSILVLDSFSGAERASMKAPALLNKVSYNPDGTQIFGACENGLIYVWDSKTGKLLKTLTGHLSRVNSFDFPSNGRHLVSGSDDTSIRIWDLKTGKSLAVYHFQDGNWFVIDENGRFDTSDGGRKYILFVKGITTYSPESYWNQFYTPGILPLFLGGQKQKEIKFADEIKKAPEVFIVSPDKNQESPSGTISITLVAKPGSNGLGNLVLYHNGSVLDENTRGLTIRQSENRKTFTVQLLEGQNTFVAGAFDKGNLIEGKSKTLLVYYNPPKIITPKLYILSVGVSQYKDNNFNLKSADNDAMVLPNSFREVAQSVYGEVKVTLLTNQQASKKGVLQALENLVNTTQKQDTVIIFLAGHGKTEKGIYHFLPYDMDITDISNTGITDKDLALYAKKLPVTKVLILLDTCESGSAASNLQVAMARGSDDKKIIAQLAKQKGAAVFSAASATQLAYEIKRIGHGILTYSIIQVLKNNRSLLLNYSGLISVDKMLSAVRDLVQKTAKEELNIDQTPIKYVWGEDFAIGK